LSGSGGNAQVSPQGPLTLNPNHPDSQNQYPNQNSNSQRPLSLPQAAVLSPSQSAHIMHLNKLITAGRGTSPGEKPHYSLSVGNIVEAAAPRLPNFAPPPPQQQQQQQQQSGHVGAIGHGPLSLTSPAPQDGRSATVAAAAVVGASPLSVLSPSHQQSILSSQRQPDMAVVGALSLRPDISRRRSVRNVFRSCLDC
jgi:hypothetical protein